MEFQIFQDENGQTVVQQVVPADEVTDSETGESISTDLQSEMPTYPQEDWNVVGSTVVVGIAVVFAILAILIFVFWAFGKILSKPEAPQKEMSAEISKTLPDPVLPPPSANGVTNEVVAVITAAVTAFGESTGRKLRVAGITRTGREQKSGRSRWSQAGIFDTIKR